LINLQKTLPEENELKLEDLEILEDIGRGSGGIVKKVIFLLLTHFLMVDLF